MQTEPEPKPEPTGEQPAQADAQAGIDPEILDIQAEEGVQLLDGDQEVSMIVRDKGKRKFYQSIEAACQAKKQRLSAQPQTPTNPASRLPVRGTAPKGLPEDWSANKMWQHVTYKK